MKIKIAAFIAVFLLLEVLGLSVIYASGPWGRNNAVGAIVMMTHLISVVIAAVFAAMLEETPK